MKQQSTGGEFLKEIPTRYRNAIGGILRRLKPQDRIAQLEGLLQSKRYLEPSPAGMKPIEQLPWSQTFASLRTEIDEQKLPPRVRADLDSRLRDVLQEELAMHRKAEHARDNARIDTELPDPAIEKRARDYLADIAAAPDQQLYAGLGVLVKDIVLHIWRRIKGESGKEHLPPTEGEKLFLKASGAPLPGTDEKPDPLFEAVLKDDSLPSGFADAASRGRANLNPLLNPSIQTDATNALGMSYFSRLMRHFKTTICESDDGPYKQLKKGVTRVLLPTSLITTLVRGASAASVLLPPVVYAACILGRIGLAAYCEEASSEVTPNKTAEQTRQPRRTSKRSSKAGKANEQPKKPSRATKRKK